MKKTFATTLLGLFVLPCFGQSQVAKTGPYLGLIHSSLKIKFNDLPNTARTTNTIGVTVGAPINNNLWLEAKLLTGTSKNNIDNVELELDHYVGANLLGRLPIPSSNFSLYGTLGAGQSKVTARRPGFQSTADDSSVSYGYGLMYEAARFSVRVGYENLYSEDGLEMDGVNITGGYRF